MTTDNSRRLRRYGPELKAQMLAESAVLGASVAKVAMAHGINANIVHGWRKQARESGGVTLATKPAGSRPTPLACRSMAARPA